MVIRKYILLLIFMLVSTGVGYGQAKVSQSLENAEQTISQSNSKKIVQKQGETLTKREQRQLTKRQKSKSKEIEGEKVKSVPVSSKNIDVIKAQNKKATMGQMHKINKAMRKSMMRHHK